MSKNLPLVESLAWIICSTLFITGGTYAVAKNALRHQKQRRSDPNFFLSRIVQTGPQREALSTVYLAERMGVSADRPRPIASFRPKEAEARLLASPVIRKASVKVIEPNTIYVDYTVRQPLAWLYDFENAALDEEAVPFPVFPFFSPKTLPEIYLGISAIEWGQKIEGKKIELALAMLSSLASKKLTVRRIDVSKIFEKSLGRREIVVIIDHDGASHTLRLTARNYAQELGNYMELKGQLPHKPHIIDLRIPQLGYVEERD